MGKVVKMSVKEFADEILWGKKVYPFAKEKNNDNEKDEVLNYDYWYFVRPIAAAGMRFLLFGYYGDYEGDKMRVFCLEEMSVESAIKTYLRYVGFENMEVYYDTEGDE